jgi:hypothetical protein
VSTPRPITYTPTDEEWAGLGLATSVANQTRTTTPDPANEGQMLAPLTEEQYVIGIMQGALASYVQQYVAAQAAKVAEAWAQADQSVQAEVVTTLGVEP